ncbi:MAG: oligosaccharide flippase family protein, partial [Solirubrobacteraceae bacterium]
PAPVGRVSHEQDPGAADPKPAGGGRAASVTERTALSGVRWTGGARLVAEVAALGASVALARLVPPDDFGRFAVVLVVVLIAGAFSGDGVAAPLVQRETLTRPHVATAMALGLLGGTLLMLLTAAAGESLRPLIGDEIARLLQLAAPVFLLSALTAVPQALLMRRLSFRQLGLVDAAGALAGAAAGVGLAVAGLDAPALVLGILTGQLTTMGLMLALARPPLPRWHRREAAELAGFGLPNAGAALASIGSQNVDYLILAARLDLTLVGFYWRGYQLGVEYQRKLSGILLRLALPLYSRSESLEHQLALRHRIVRLQTLTIFPLLAALILLAPLLVPAVFGTAWEPAVLPAQILAVAGMIAAAQTGIGPLMTATGHPKALLRWNLGNMVCFAAAVYLLAPLGLTGLCIGVVAFRLLRFLAAYRLLLHGVLDLRLRSAWTDCAPALTATAATVASGLALTAIASDALPGWLEGAALALLVPAVYVPVLGLLFPTALADLRGVLGRLVRPGSSGAAAGGREILAEGA